MTPHSQREHAWYFSHSLNNLEATVILYGKQNPEIQNLLTQSLYEHSVYLKEGSK